VADGVGGVTVGVGAKVKEGVKEGVIREGVGVLVRVGMRVSDGRGVLLGVRVREGVALGTAVGG
jgi:hypothetical protein